jgi:hypothetical protein
MREGSAAKERREHKENEKKKSALGSSLAFFVFFCG